MKKDMTVKELLIKHELYNEHIARTCGHLYIAKVPAQVIAIKILDNKHMPEEELANEIFNLIEKCDQERPDFDSKLEVDLIRIGLGLQMYQNGHSSSKWPSSTFADDDFGFGQKPTDILDEMLDSTDGEIDPDKGFKI